MRLNELSPAKGSRPDGVRVGRGIGSTKGKTCGRGHKGQKARSGGYHKINFEGGQMPIQRRLPKIGFSSRVGRTVAEITLTELSKIHDEVITIDVIRSHGLITSNIKSVKVILSGELDKKVTLKGIRATKGAVEAIQSKGGTVEA